MWWKIKYDLGGDVRMALKEDGRKVFVHPSGCRHLPLKGGESNQLGSVDNGKSVQVYSI